MEEKEQQQQQEQPQEDETKKIIDDLNAKHQAEMDAEKSKYSKLLRAYANGERGESSDSTPSEDDLKKHYEDNVRLIHKNQAKAIDQAKALLEVRDYRMNVLKERDIFLASNGTPTNEDIDNAQKVADAMQQSIEVSNGDDAVYRAAMASRLVDSIYKR